MSEGPAFISRNDFELMRKIYFTAEETTKQGISAATIDYYRQYQKHIVVRRVHVNGLGIRRLYKKEDVLRVIRNTSLHDTIKAEIIDVKRYGSVEKAAAAKRQPIAAQQAPQQAQQQPPLLSKKTVETAKQRKLFSAPKRKPKRNFYKPENMLSTKGYNKIMAAISNLGENVMAIKADLGASIKDIKARIEYLEGEWRGHAEQEVKPETEPTT